VKESCRRSTLVAQVGRTLRLDALWGVRCLDDFDGRFVFHILNSTTGVFWQGGICCQSPSMIYNYALRDLLERL
jgi:hypothetical protein